MRSMIRARVLLPGLIAAVSLGLLGVGPPTGLAMVPHRHVVAAGQAADPCSTGTLSGPFAVAKGKRALTLMGPTRPYAGEATQYCGTLTLPGKPALQQVDIKINGKVVASAGADTTRYWHALLVLTSAKPAVIRAVWHRGKASQLISAPLTVHPNPAPDTRPTSLDLIARALAAHRITRQAALVDQIYALLAPEKLPRSLTGSRPLPDLGDSGVFAAAADGLSSLSAVQKAAVMPLLGPYQFAKPRSQGRPDGKWPPLACDRVTPTGVVIPPFDSKVPPGWAFIGTKHFKIWYATKDLANEDFVYTTAARSRATALLIAKEAEHVWGAETGLFGRTPLSDADQKCNGGDGRLDIYVVRESFAASALTNAFTPYDCKNTPAYITIGPDGATSENSVQAVLAHEFFHTIELSYSPLPSCVETGWLGEATANWAIDYAYPPNNYEQSSAYDYFACDYSQPLDTGTCNFHHNAYEDYIYLFFLAHRFDPGVIPAIWDDLQHTSVRAAIDDAVPGGVAESWHQFALDLWNRDPVDNFTTWDKIPYKLSNSPTAIIALGGKHSQVIAPARGYLESWSSQYQYYPVTDSKVSQITFSHYGFTERGNSERVDVVLDLGDGEFQQADWSSGEDQTFCREKDNEDIVGVLVMYSNGDIFGKENGNYGRGEQIKALDACTPTGYTGTIKNVLTISNSSESMTQTANATVTFKLDGAVSNPGLGQYQFDTTGGKVKLKVDGTAGPCTITGSGSFAIATWKPPGQVTGPGGQIIANDGISPKSPYSGTGAVTGAPPITSHNSCVPSTVPYYMEGQWWATDNGTPTAKIRYHQVLTGSYTMTAPGGLTSTWTWNLQPLFGS